MSHANDDVDAGRTWMRRALELAERGRGHVSPNPIVGAVVVRDGRPVAQGWHRRLGEAHAEVMALDRAGAKARGADLYVTLEPCAHTGRTPPCTEAIVRAGIRRCFVALRDPHLIVNGRGIRELRRAGVRVTVGTCAREARHALEGYWLAHTQGRPRVTWKVASTLDGRIADSAGRSRWITGAESRRAGHRLRARSDAVLIGAGTARADDPRLTARVLGASRQPLRVVCSTGLDLPLSLRVLEPPLARGTVVACASDAPRARARVLERRGVRVWRLPTSRGRVSPRALARRLARAGCHEVLLEGGATLGTAWMRAGLVDRVALFTAPLVLGSSGLAWCGALGIERLARARRGRIAACGRHGADAYALVEFGD